MSETNKKKVRKLIDKYIIIEWIDSVGLNNIWSYNETVQDLNLDIIRSIGHVVYEDDQSITLAAHVGSYQLAGVLCIPRVSIKKTKVLSHYKKIFDKK